VLVDLSPLDRHSLAIGVIGIIAAFATLVAFQRYSREPRSGAVSLVVGSYALGFAVGFALRVIGAHVGGANIGGGLLILIAPVVIPVAVWLLLRKVWRLTEGG